MEVPTLSPPHLSSPLPEEVTGQASIASGKEEGVNI
jgi:hypothetical protein